MRLIDLANTSAALATTRSRRTKVGLLADCLRGAGPDQVALSCGLLMGVLPQGRIGVGAAMLRGLEVPPAPQATLSVGDIGDVLGQIAGCRGAGSQRARASLLQGLFVRASAEEQRFLKRLLLGELRQGALEGVMVEAVAAAAGFEAAQVRRAVMFGGDLPQVAGSALGEGAAGLARYRLQLLRPVRPMLAGPAEDIGRVLADFGQAAFEYKLDGARIQLHKCGDEVRIFTRHLNEVTGRVPELVEAARRLSASQIVLDGEVIAFDKGGRPLPFQVTMSRFGRRSDIAEQRRRLPLSVRWFDCLHLDGDDLVDLPGTERQAALEQLLPEALRVPRLVTADPEQAGAFLRRAIAEGHEGVMAKSLHAPYRAGSRGGEWLKLKPVHTLDLVVLAAEWGSGRRSGWLSNLHLGARDPDSGGFVMLGKTFKGLSDATLAWQTEQLLSRETGREGGVVHVRPELVVEVAFNELQRSRQYPAGLALRFARVRRYRDDKPASEADTLASVHRIHEQGLAGVMR